MHRLRTAAVADTKSVAASLARLSRAGDLIVLAGEMGVGKTAFVQGFARELDVAEPVTSPTFTLVRSYALPVRPGRPRVLHHVDVYRLERMNEVADLAIGELIDDRSVTLIEWGDAVLDALPKDRLEVSLAYGEGPDDRTIEVVRAGTSWSSRLAALTQHWQAWA